MNFLKFTIFILHFAFFISLSFTDGWSTDRIPTSRTSPPPPTLARLSFWLSPDRFSEFETAYREKLVPILEKHGLTESSERGRATIDSVFSRLFEVRAPSEIPLRNKALRNDTAWIENLRALGASFGTPERDGLVRHSLHLYAAPGTPPRVLPAGPGKTVLAGRGRGHWRTYDVTDGLAAANVHEILQDREGSLWFATYNGVNRYDGHTWTIFTTRDGLVDNRVVTALQDPEGAFWFGTHVGGISRYDPSTSSGQTWTNFTTRDGLPDNWVMCSFVDREGAPWFGTRAGVCRYDPLRQAQDKTPSRGSGQSFTTLTTKDGPLDYYILSIFQDRDEYLWFGSSERGVSRYNPLEGIGKKWKTFTTRDGLAGNIVNSILQDRQGNLWFSTEDGGLSRYDPLRLADARSGQVFTTFTTQDGLGDSRLETIFEDREGVLWVGTQGGGVSRFDGTKFTTFTTEDGLAQNVVRSIFQDREGHLWFSTGGGVSQYAGSSFTTFTTREGLEDNLVETVFEDREGVFWIGTSNAGVIRYDGTTFTAFSKKDGLVDNRVMSIFEDREGILYIGTWLGMSRYDGATFTAFTTKDVLGHNGIRSVFRDREGILWFGLEMGGVIRYDGVTWARFTPEDGLAPDKVFSIFQDREGHLWFGGTLGDGLSRYDGQRFITFTTEDGLAHNDVFSIFQDREGFHWFGTQGGGVSRYDGKSFETFTTQDGLANNVVRSIIQDREGHLWFGTFGGGVSRYDGNDFQNMDLRDGLAGNQVLSVIQDRNGNLWFGTYGGLTRYRQPPSSPPLVSIEAVVADRRYEAGYGVAIPSSVNLTAFEFKGISFKTRAESMVYRYRLKGYEEVWKSTRTRRVEYPDLPRGDYTFEVRAVDRDLVSSDRPATARLRVHFPYERIALVSALAIAIGLIGWQTTRAVRRGIRLREGEARFRGLSEASFEGIVLHEEGKILDANRALATMFGYEPSEMIGKTAAELSKPESHETIYRNIQSGNERPYEVVGLKKDGSTFPIEVIGRDVPYRGHIVRVTAIRDLTDRKRAEEERAKLDEQLQQLRYLYRFRLALGNARTPEEIIRQAGASVMEALSVLSSGGLLIEYEGRTHRFGADDGEDQTHYERPLFWGGQTRGSLRLSCGVAMSESQERVLLDETAGQIAQALEAREMEMQILQSGRLVSLGQMAAGVAHELNQPLTAISTTAGDVYSRLVENIDLPKENLESMMQDVIGLVKRMAGTVDHLRIFSRDTSQEAGAPFSMNEVIRSSLKLIEAQLKSHGIGLHLDLTEDLPAVSGHPHQMEQVFLNLLSNARDALDEKDEAVDRGSQNTGTTPEPGITNHEPRGGRGGVSEKRLIIRTRREGDEVVAEVEDNGAGIDEKDVGRVFEPFYTTKEADKGTGLGLSISYAIVKNHGGEIVCESRQGEGTVFRVRLPGEKSET